MLVSEGLAALSALPLSAVRCGVRLLGFHCITVTVITVIVSRGILLPGAGARIACGCLTKSYGLTPVVVLKRVVAVAIQKANATVI